MFAQTFFIVWRESIEALLVIGILHTWLRHSSQNPRALRFLWAGVCAGIGAALILSFVLQSISNLLPPEGQDYFQMALILIAGILIVQMVFWMRQHGKTLKNQLENDLSDQLRSGRLWGIFGLALIAVMREGTETVLFLQGVFAATRGNSNTVAGGVILAILAATASYALLQLGGRYLSWKVFFRLTETMLLFLACALMVSAAGYLVSFGLLPYTDPLWDSAALLDDTTRFGAVIAGMTGYRSMPDNVTLATWLVYWGAIASIFWLQGTRLNARERKA
ncbi:FTR1 family iron permease [Thalassospira alkalitolerans]|uniref:FTR1 family iron permease n=1 Tax=Thalassospira alkalitolerans TaxID=1293890 RepID=UPI0030EF02B3|tara:strand:- start:116629 stop:117462 length:834 start_codon:yes stop_codon:yes gene_type:complete